MELLTAEQAKRLTPEKLKERQDEKLEEDRQRRAGLKGAAQAFVATLPKDADDVPYVKIRADDIGAWQAVMFWSQQLRDAGDQAGRVKYGHIAHAFELGYWKEA